MQRRNFLIGVGTAAVGSSALVGSGAFTSTEAERVASVEVADDPDALLGIEPSESPDSAYAVLADDSRGRERLELRIDDSNENVAGQGVNSNSETWFCNVFTVKNQGTQPIEVGFDTDGGSLRTNIGWRWSAEEDVVEASSPRPAETEEDTPCGTNYRLGKPGQASLPIIGAGEEFTVSFRIALDDYGGGSSSGSVESVTISGDAVGSNDE